MSLHSINKRGGVLLCKLKGFFVSRKLWKRLSSLDWPIFNPMHPYKAVLFDFDGVIGQTMEDNSRAWDHAFSSVGIPFDPMFFFLAEGKKAAEFVADVLKRHGQNDLAIQPLIDLKNAHYSKYSKFSFYEPSLSLTNSLQKQGFKVGVVSGGSRDRLTNGPASTFLASLDTLVTGDDVILGKPSPEAYLTAATRLNIDPKLCLVVENAPLGIAAAKGAGMFCVAVCSTLPAKYLQEADCLVQSLKDVPQVLTTYGYKMAD